MPMYDYKDKNSGKVVTVIRSFNDYKIEPYLEEAKDSGFNDEEYNRASWERLVGSGIQVTRGPNFTGSKGNWVALLAASGACLSQLGSVEWVNQLMGMIL